jgi:hypothetical protein
MSCRRAVRLEPSGLASGRLPADLAGLQLDGETTELFLHGNAERVFGLAASPVLPLDP